MKGLPRGGRGLLKDGLKSFKSSHERYHVKD